MLANAFQQVDPQTGMGILIAAIAGLIAAIGYLLKTTGPKVIEAWLNARMRAEEYKHTREAATQTMLMEAFGKAFEDNNAERDYDRQERSKDREEAARQRGQNERLLEEIRTLARQVKSNGDLIRILGQNAAQVADHTRDLRVEVRELRLIVDHNGRPIND